MHHGRPLQSSHQARPSAAAAGAPIDTRYTRSTEDVRLPETTRNNNTAEGPLASVLRHLVEHNPTSPELPDEVQAGGGAQRIEIGREETGTAEAGVTACDH